MHRLTTLPDAVAVWPAHGAGSFCSAPAAGRRTSISAVAHPAWRATCVGTYRLWRDGGFAVGALLAGVLDIRTAVWIVAALTAASGSLAAVRMYETHGRPATVPGRPEPVG